MRSMPALADPEFAALMTPLGPFEPAPRIAAAVSGGPDSMALALLADRWARERGGSLLVLVVDHGLRPESGREAADTAERLGARGIAVRVRLLAGLPHGPGLAARARAARYDALTDACRAAGMLHLLLGHHAGDQAETVLMRTLSASGPAGLAGIAGVVETAFVRLLRPLLSVPPERLRATLVAAGVGWVEDPSNADARALRPRLRELRADRSGVGAATSALVAAAIAAGRERARRDGNSTAALAGVALRPEGFARLDGGPLPASALAALAQAVTGATFPPRTAAMARLAASPRPATFGGARLLAAPRGLLLVREAAAMQSPVPALPGAVWDRRFRLAAGADPPQGATLGALGADAARLRRHSDLPAAVLVAVPALRQGNQVLAVPHLDYPDAATCSRVRVLFAPARPVAGAPFFAA